MKVVFQLMELKDEIEDAAGRLFEKQGGTLGTGLTLARINVDTQDLLFTLNDEEPEVEIIDASPTVTDEGYDAGNDPKLDGVNPDA